MCEHVFNNYYSELERIVEDDAMKHLLFMTLTMFYPFIEEIGFRTSLPLAVVVEEENEIMSIVECLDVFSPHIVISTSEKPKDIKKHLEAPIYGSVFFSLEEGRYTSENLQQIASSSRRIEANIQKVFLSVVFVTKGVQSKYEDLFAGTIFMSGKVRITERAKAQRLELMKQMISFAISHENEVKNEARRRAIELEAEFALFDVPAILLKLFLRTQRLTTAEIEKFEDKIEEALDHIAKEWESADDPETYATAFRKILYENADELPEMFDRKKFPERAIERMDEIILFDENSYYLPGRLLKELCQKIGSVRYVESQLVNARVLIGEGRNRNYFSLKTEIITEHGIVKRKRFSKIAREKIDIPWELTLQELYERRGGEKNYGNETGQGSKLIDICESR